MLTMGTLQSSHTLEKRLLLCVAALLSLLRLTDAQALPQCAIAITPGQRVNCGFGGITPVQCRDLRCCYDVAEPTGAIWCYNPNMIAGCTSSPVPGASRINCPGATGGISAALCTDLGCCFDEDPGFPFCYRPSFQVAQCSNIIAPNDRVNCAPAGVTPFDCINIGCCFDNSFGANTIFCYNPMPTTVPQACTNVILPAFRISCGPLSVVECTQRGCCHDGTECYHRTGQPASCMPLAVELRRECGYPDISGQECALNNCCFDDSASGVTQCYTPNELQCSENVAQENRIDCGYVGISQQRCQNPSCCYNDNVAPFCYFPLDQVTMRPGTTDCTLGDLFSDIGNLLGQWTELVTAPQNFQSVLQKSSIFSITTYCGIYTTAIDAITGCAISIVRPFANLNQDFNNTFYRDLNNIQNAKGICAAVGKQVPNTPLCIPESVAICGLTSFDILTTLSQNLSNDQICDATEQILRGVSTCIGLSTGACTPIQQDGYTAVRNNFTKIADRIAINCINCKALSNFLLDTHPDCSWNLTRIYPNPQLANYCEYATNAVTCAWELWKGCPILPREYFERALSALDKAFFVGGCNSFLPRIPDFVFFPEWEINIPPCVSAGITCAQELSFAVGVGELAGPFGGYTIDQVVNRVEIIRQELVEGNYQGLCGRPDQRTAGKNPIADCINDLFNSCGGNSATMQQMSIVQTTVEWYQEACEPGCTQIAQRFINFRTECPNAVFNIDPSDIPMQLFLSQLPSIPGLDTGSSSELCRQIWSYVGCISSIIMDCPFLSNRLTQGRDLLIQVITGDPSGTLPINAHVCGIKLDFPFTYDPDLTLFLLSFGIRSTAPLWLISLTALTTMVHTLF